MQQKSSESPPFLLGLDTEWSTLFHLQHAEDRHIGRHIKYRFSYHPQQWS